MGTTDRGGETIQKRKSSNLSLEEKKDRARFARIKRVYGLTKEQYDSLYTDSCVICQRPYGGTVKPVVDHSHKTGTVRGIICGYCNHRVVGRHTDSALVGRLASYLQNDTGFVVPPKPKKKKKRKVKIAKR